MSEFKSKLTQHFFEKAIKERILTFYDLGYEFEYEAGFVDETEHYLRRGDDVIRFYNDKYSFQFNQIGKTIVVQDVHDSTKLYDLPTIFINADLLDAILEVVVLLGWK